MFTPTSARSYRRSLMYSRARALLSTVTFTLKPTASMYSAIRLAAFSRMLLVPSL